MKQVQGSQGGSIFDVLGRHVRMLLCLDWSWQEENGRTRGQRVNKAGRQRADV